MVMKHCCTALLILTCAKLCLSQLQGASPGSQKVLLQSIDAVALHKAVTDFNLAKQILHQLTADGQQVINTELTHSKVLQEYYTNEQLVSCSMMARIILSKHAICAIPLFCIAGCLIESNDSNRASCLVHSGGPYEGLCRAMPTHSTHVQHW